MPTTRSPAAKPRAGGASSTRPSDSWPMTSRSRPGGAAIIAGHDLAIGAAHADAERPHQQRAVGGRRLRHIFNAR